MSWDLHPLAFEAQEVSVNRYFSAHGKPPFVPSGTSVCRRRAKTRQGWVFLIAATVKAAASPLAAKDFQKCQAPMSAYVWEVPGSYVAGSKSSPQIPPGSLS